MLYAEKMVRKYSGLERELTAEAADAREARNYWIGVMRHGGAWLATVAAASGLSVVSVSRIAERQTDAAPDLGSGAAAGAISVQVHPGTTRVDRAQPDDFGGIGLEPARDDLPAHHHAQLEQGHHGQGPGLRVRPGRAQLEQAT